MVPFTALCTFSNARTSIWRTRSRETPNSDARSSSVMQIAVRVQAAEVTREQTTALANRIRDKIPDLPFPSERTGAPASPDPCVLVTVQEVEAVVGKLVVPPFRSDEGKPLAMENGASCTYYTAGHHALVLTPTWSYGGSAFEAMRGVGRMLEGIAPTLHNDAADTLDTGPWEDAAGDPATGSLYFLKGDRALEVHYLVSTTDMPPCTSPTRRYARANSRWSVTSPWASCARVSR